MTTWHIITGEYPPQTGGVSDYTRQVARGLVAAGDRVEIWAPPCAPSAVRAPSREPRELRERREARESGEPCDVGITVHRLADRFGPRSLWQLMRGLEGLPAPRRLLVQYVPHAFGWKGANILFCLWLRLRRRDSTWVMFHEVMFLAERGARLSKRALATANRLMARLVARSADRAFVSIPGWGPMLAPILRPGTPVTWLPVPSSIPVHSDVPATAAIRVRYGGGHPLVGHFGTYGAAVGALLNPALEDLAELSDCRVLLLGDGSDAMCRTLTSAHPALAGRVSATGRLSARDLSPHIAACDLMVQPYPDGISSRRTSAMAALSHGRPMVTTSGWLTEPMWAEADAAVLAPVDDPHAFAAAAAAMLVDVSRRETIGRRAAALYDARFDVRHLIAALRSEAR